MISDTLDIKDSQKNSHREEEDDGLHQNIAHKEASCEIKNAKHKGRCSNIPRGSE